MLSGESSSVHARVGFDTEMFTPESKEHLGQRDKIVDDLGNNCGESDEKSKKKVLVQNLIDLWKNEDRNNPDKVIFNFHLDGEEQSQPSRVFSKIFKLTDWNLPKKPFVDLDILKKSVNDFDPNSKIGHVFVVHIHFQEFKDPEKKDVQLDMPLYF